MKISHKLSKSSPSFTVMRCTRTSFSESLIRRSPISCEVSFTQEYPRGFPERQADHTISGVDVPYRIESGKQAQEVKGIGAQMAERVSLASIRARHATRS